MKPGPTLAELRRFAISRSLFGPTTLGRAISKLGFVQADPIRAPARAQDLTLRHRVKNYRAGDLEKRYPKLGIEEDYFVNYGYLPETTHTLMHPRTARRVSTPAEEKSAKAVLAFVRENGSVHPRAVDAHFNHGKASNWFGGSSNVTTQLLDQMHYRGLLRVARRDSGTRVYAERKAAPHATPDCLQQAAPIAADPHAALDALIDAVVNLYAPLPAATLGQLVSKLMVGTPQWAAHRAVALRRAKERLAHATVEGLDWYWPRHEKIPASSAVPDQARLLAPFDPVVWDRLRFETFWGWAYRFEAYTPAPKRKLGYYALPFLWRDEIIGWGNVTLRDEQVVADIGLAGKYKTSRALGRDFGPALDEELTRLAVFLGASAAIWHWVKT